MGNRELQHQKRIHGDGVRIWHRAQALAHAEKHGDDHGEDGEGKDNMHHSTKCQGERNAAQARLWREHAFDQRPKTIYVIFRRHKVGFWLLVISRFNGVCRALNRLREGSFDAARITMLLAYLETSGIVGSTGQDQRDPQ